MKKLAKTLSVISAVLLLFALLAGALFRIFTDTVWVKKEYERIDIEAQSGYSTEDAAYVLGAMMDYSIGRFDELDKVSVEENGEHVLFFNESELSHMVDVRALTLNVLRLGLAALIVGLAFFIIMFIVLRGEGLRRFAKAFLITLGVLLIVMAALGVWMAVDFDSFWAMFHVVFLDLESSTFDPAVSRMIRICPGELFSDFIKHFALIAGIGLLVSVTASILFLCFKKRLPGAAETPRTIYLSAYWAWLAIYGAYAFTRIRAFLFIATGLLIVGLILYVVFLKRAKRNGHKVKERID